MNRDDFLGILAEVGGVGIEVGKRNGFRFEFDFVHALEYDFMLYNYRWYRYPKDMCAMTHDEH